MCDSYVGKPGVWLFDQPHCQGSQVQLIGHEILDTPFAVRSFVQSPGFVLRWLLRDPENGLIFETLTRDDDWEDGSVYEETDLYFPLWEVSEELNSPPIPQGWTRGSLVQSEALQIVSRPIESEVDEDYEEEDVPVAAAAPSLETKPLVMPHAVLPNLADQTLTEAQNEMSWWWVILGTLGGLLLVVLAGAYWWSRQKEPQKRSRKTSKSYTNWNSGDEHQYVDDQQHGYEQQYVDAYHPGVAPGYFPFPPPYSGDQMPFGDQGFYPGPTVF